MAKPGNRPGTISSVPLWTAADAAAAMGARLEGAGDWVANGISIDTRTIEPGDIFFAIKGENSDGHEYVAMAIEKGAACAVVSDMPEGLEGEAPLAVVDDTFTALEDLGRAARARVTNTRIAAVTGSVGKTGTKEGLFHILSPQGKTHASAASFNNHLGVPLTLARMPADTEYAIFEIGMNHPGEISPLVQMVKPEVAIITTVEAVHMEFFKSVEEIADAKAEIFDGLKPGGTAILNRDNRFFDWLKGRALDRQAGRIIAFGEHAEADARVLRMVLNPDESLVSARIGGHDITYKVGVPGKHIVMNSLAMLACAHALGADLALAGMSLASLAPPAGRGGRTTIETEAGRFLLIDESYNANPASMRAALAALGNTPPGKRGRRIAVMGDMLELGPQSRAMHAGLSEDVEANGVDLVFACGPLMESLWDALPPQKRGAYAENSAELAPRLAEEISKGDVVMVKGSLGSRMKVVVEAVKKLGRAVAPAREEERV